MPARVFAFVMIGNQESYTSKELAQGLEVSPAAISGAVRYLVDTRLLVRERAPRTRGDLFRLTDGDVWAGIFASRIPIMDQVNAYVTDAIAMLEVAPEADVGPGLHRLRETREFFDFMRKEIPAMLERWEVHRATGAPGT